MEERLTEELLDELLSSPKIEGYLADHRTQTRNLSAYLTSLLDERGLKRADVVRDAGVDFTYGYQIFNGQRSHPSRNILLQLAFAMHLTIQETDRVLQAAGRSKLYCKERRDAIIIFCLDRQSTLDEVNTTLYQWGEETIV